MTEKVTLEIPDEVIQQAQATSTRTGLALEQVLAEWLVRGAERDVESLLVPGAEYPIYTPLGNEGAAQVLMGVLKAHQASKGSDQQ